MRDWLLTVSARPLNLASRTGRGTVEQEYDEQVATARRAHQTAEKALADKRNEPVARGATPADRARILPEYDRAVTYALQELNKLSARKFEVRDAAKNQASLFGMGNEGQLAESQNKSVLFQAQPYEIFWTSQNAFHLSDRHERDPKGHPLLHVEAAQVVVQANVIFEDRRDRHRLLAYLKGKLYVAVVKFVIQPRGNRCVIITCFLGNPTHEKEYKSQRPGFH